MHDVATLELERDGAQLCPGLAAPDLFRFEDICADLGPASAGLRLSGRPDLAALISPESRVGAFVAKQAGHTLQPVRAILFDKRADESAATHGRQRANWALGWHQDRTIAVRARCEVPGYGPWSTKQGLTHVEPPFAVIDAMLTVRIHLDPVDADNAPLRIAAGSHLFGRIPVDAIESRVADCPLHVCLAQPGDVWIYHTPIVHASDPAGGTAPSRRVLQVDYCAQALPAGLEWLGVG